MVPERTPRSRELSKMSIRRLGHHVGVCIPVQEFLLTGRFLYKASCKLGIIGLFTGVISILEIGSLEHIALRQFPK